jgi:hypothetical protein
MYPTPNIVVRSRRIKWAEHAEAMEEMTYLGVLISLCLFLFAAQPKEFCLDGLKKLEQRRHKCVELRGEYVE